MMKEHLEGLVHSLEQRFEDKGASTDRRITGQIEYLDRRLETAVAGAEEKFTMLIKEIDLRAEARSESLAVLIASQRAAAQEAVQKADAATEKRFDAVNEFRAQLNDVMSHMMPRSEAESGMKAMQERYDALIHTLSDRFASNAARLDRSEGQQIASARFQSTVLAGAAIIVSIVFGLLAFLPHGPTVEASRGFGQPTAQAVVPFSSLAPRQSDK